MRPLKNAGGHVKINLPDNHRHAKLQWCNLYPSMANRPQIDPKRKQAATEMLRVRVTPNEAAKLRKVAKQQDKTVSQVLRAAILQAGVK